MMQSLSENKISAPVVLFFTCLILLLKPLPAQITSFAGMWQGPHPELRHINFILKLALNQAEGIYGAGYWLDQNIVTAGFPIDSVSVNCSRIRIYINQWQCVYTGSCSKDGQKLIGRFECAGEDPDSVVLNKIPEQAVFGLFPDHSGADGRYLYQYRVPVRNNDGLEVAHVKDLSIDSTVLANMVGEVGSGQYGNIHAFLLLKKNALTAENYFFGFHKDVLHPVESVSKSIISLAIGILRDKDHIANLSMPVSAFFQSKSSWCSDDLSKINLKDLLTMSGGIVSEQDKILMSNNRLEYLLSCNLEDPRGRHFAYQNWNTEILGAIIRESSGVFADDFCKEHLFEPLGIQVYDWETFKNNGYPLCGGALWMRPRDMAKIGLLILNNGLWHGKRIISGAWINESTEPQIATGINEDWYGYHWWISNITSGAGVYKMIWANGLGSQFILIFPDLDMVMVFTGGNWEGGNDGRSWDILNMLEKHLSVLNTAGL